MKKRSDSGRSMEQKLRARLEECASDRGSILRQIEKSWSRQFRRPDAAEIDHWIATGRE